jgi:hypothetical protein
MKKNVTNSTSSQSSSKEGKGLTSLNPLGLISQALTGKGSRACLSPKEINFAGSLPLSLQKSLSRN